MIYFTYFALYYIIGFVICMSYLIYKTLTADVDDDFDKTEFFTLMLFYVVYLLAEQLSMVYSHLYILNIHCVL